MREILERKLAGALHVVRASLAHQFYFPVVAEDLLDILLFRRYEDDHLLEDGDVSGRLVQKVLHAL